MQKEITIQIRKDGFDNLWYEDVSIYNYNEKFLSSDSIEVLMDEVKKIAIKMKGKLCNEK